MSNDGDPKVKLYRLLLGVDIEATSIDEARLKAGVAARKFTGQQIEAGVSRVVRARYSSRADRLAEAESLLSDAKGAVDELRDEIEQWRDNLPESLQDSEKGSQLDDCVGALEDLVQSLEEAEGNFGNVEFPGMY